MAAGPAIAKAVQTGSLNLIRCFSTHIYMHVWLHSVLAKSESEDMYVFDISFLFF